MSKEKAIEAAAGAVEDQAVANAEAAKAITKEKTTEAVVATVAAAEGTVALAKTQAAETMQKAENTIKTFEEHQSWLETQVGTRKKRARASCRINKKGDRETSRKRRRSLAKDA